MQLKNIVGKKGSLREHLVRAASDSFIIKVATTALSLVTAVVLARLLGAEGFGVYAFCLAASQMLAVPAMLGMQQLVVREFTSYRTQGAFSLMRVHRSALLGLSWIVQAQLHRTRLTLMK